MSNLFGKFSRSGSNSSINRMENDLKILEENTSKFGKCQNKISKIFIKCEVSYSNQHIKSKCLKIHIL